MHPVRVAIVGAGPWGVYAAERLATAAERRATRVEVAIFDDGVPGHGPNFHPGLPDHHLLNFPVGHVRPWVARDTILPRDLRAPLDWIEARTGAAPAEGEPVPRRVVGAYFAAALDALVEHRGPEARIRLVRARVVDAELADGSWRLTLAGGDPAVADHLLLVTGVPFDAPPDEEARRLRAFAERHGLTSVDRWRTLNPASVEAGGPVGVRGLGITFIDVALDLTEGRGGHFEARGHALHYVPSGLEAGPIVAFSRSGRLPAPKTRGSWPHRAVDPPRVFDDETAASLVRLDRPLDFDRDLWPLILAEMGEDVAREAPDPVDLARSLWPLPGSDEDGHQARVLARLRADIADAERGHDGSARIAVIETWGRVFPELAPVLSLGGLTAASQRRFDEEIRPAWGPLAFGPPLANARKIEALLAGGWIDLSLALNGSLETDEENAAFVVRSGSASAPVRHFVDARVPRFDLVGTVPPLFAALAARGHLTAFVNRNGEEEWKTGGVAVDRRASAVPARGHPQAPLAVIGAPTEGCVIGTDALPGTRSWWTDAWAAAVLAGTSVR